MISNISSTADQPKRGLTIYVSPLFFIKVVPKVSVGLAGWHRSRHTGRYDCKWPCFLSIEERLMVFFNWLALVAQQKNEGTRYTGGSSNGRARHRASEISCHFGGMGRTLSYSKLQFVSIGLRKELISIKNLMVLVLLLFIGCEKPVNVWGPKEHPSPMSHKRAKRA
jgi:hypothetical protein